MSLLHHRFPNTRRWLAWVALGLGAWALGLAVEAYNKAHLWSPPPTKLLLDRHDRYLAEVGAGEDAPRGYWRVSRVPDRVAMATIAIEDRRFWSHPGVDPKAIFRALAQNVRSGQRVSGASTLAMQVARMQDPGPRTYRKKAVEALTALFLVFRHGRREVLAQYLRLVPYSNRIRGIGFAARRYFDKPIADLSWAEIAFLAAIPQSPSQMNPYRYVGRRRAVKRGQRILNLLFEQKVLTSAELALAQAQLETLDVGAAPVRSVAAMHVILRLEAMLGTAHRDPVVQTTLDLDLTDRLFGVLNRAVYLKRGRGAENGALIVADRQTSEVLVYLGSADYFDEAHAGAIDYAATLRPSGSTLKPFVYGAALDRGTILPNTVLDDLFRAKGGMSNSDDRFLGPMLPRTALANSRNVPAAHVTERLGVSFTYDLFFDLGLHERAVPAEHYGLGVVLGLLPVTLFDLVGAYTSLPEGRLTPLRLVMNDEVQSRRMFSEATARRITRYLADPTARLPTFARLGAGEYPFPVALKTGTSQGYRDAWTVAYTSKYIVGVWLGRGDARPMSRLGGVSAAQVVYQALTHLHDEDFDGLSDGTFPPPSDSTPVKVCGWSGQRATKYCEPTFVEHFAHGEAPLHSCDVHVPHRAPKRTRTLVRLPPRYRAWVQARGLDAVAPEGLAEDSRGGLKVLRPEPEARLIRDPEVPVEQATLALMVSVPPGIDEVVWYVDNRPFVTVGPPFSARWPLEIGPHTFQARVPDSNRASGRVSVYIDP